MNREQMESLILNYEDKIVRLENKIARFKIFSFESQHLSKFLKWVQDNFFYDGQRYTVNPLSEVKTVVKRMTCYQVSELYMTNIIDKNTKTTYNT